MNISKFVDKNFPSLTGKTVAVSGATGGIGNHLCRHLAHLGASLILMDRSSQRSRALGESLRADFPDISVSYITLDLEDMDAVRAACAALLQSVPDYIVLNAGAYHIPRHICSTGYENVFQINFVSPYFIARTLLPAISKKGGKIVTVSSIAHNYSHIDEGDVDFRTRKRSSLVYGNAKRYLTYSLISQDGISIAHPGITLTNITAHYPKLIFAIIKHPMKVIFMSPEKASLCILAGLFASGTAEADSWTGPALLGVWGGPVQKRLATASQTERSAICGIAEQIYNDLSENGE